MASIEYGTIHNTDRILTVTAKQSVLAQSASPVTLVSLSLSPRRSRLNLRRVAASPLLSSTSFSLSLSLYSLSLQLTHFTLTIVALLPLFLFSLVLFLTISTEAIFWR